MRIKDLREDNDFTQQQIADLLHIKQNTYSQYETGQRQIPIATLITLASFYNTSIDYLLGITDTKEPYPKNKHAPRNQKSSHK
jgi:transcriptional regulator with XRE-family HTH domain